LKTASRLRCRRRAPRFDRGDGCAAILVRGALITAWCEKMTTPTRTCAGRPSTNLAAASLAAASRWVSHRSLHRWEVSSATITMDRDRGTRNEVRRLGEREHRRHQHHTNRERREVRRQPGWRGATDDSRSTFGYMTT